MCDFQIGECMQPRTMRDKTLAGADSPLNVVKTLGWLSVFLRGLEQKQGRGLTGSNSSLCRASRLRASIVCQHAMPSEAGVAVARRVVSLPVARRHVTGKRLHHQREHVGAQDVDSKN